MDVYRMKFIKKFIDWVVWLFIPFFKGIRWIFSILLIVFIFYGVRSGFLEITSRENLMLVQGAFLVPPDMGLNKRAQYATRVRGDDGLVYKCDCSFGGILNINCLAEDYLLNNKYIEQLKNQRVSLMLTSGPVLGVSLCYELSSSEKTWFDYKETSNKYMKAKNGWHAKISWTFLLTFAVLFFVRGIFWNRGIDG